MGGLPKKVLQVGRESLRSFEVEGGSTSLAGSLISRALNFKP